jgi:hypothetical protein
MRDLISIMHASGKKNEVVEMKIQDFHDWPNEILTRTKKNKLPLLCDIVQARFERGNVNMFYKTDLGSDELVVAVLKKSAEKTIVNGCLASARVNVRGIGVAKKNKILKELASRMPPNRRSFWENLPACELSEDLLKTFE